MPTRRLFRPVLFLLLLFASISCAARYPYEKKSPDELYADAGVDIEKNEPDAATAKLDYLKNKHPDFPDREGVAFRYAQIKKLYGKYWKAFVAFREFLDQYPVSGHRREAGELIYDTGVKLTQSTSSFLGLGIARDSDDGVLVLEYFVDNFQNSSLASEALRRVAQYKFETGDFQGAIRGYQRILRSYLGSQWRDLAEFRIAISHLRGVRRADQDQSELLKARESLSNYISLHPEGARLDEAAAALREADEMLAESEYKIGDYYVVIEQPFAASMHYKQAIVNYPGTEFAARAESRLAQMPKNIEIPPAKFPVKVKN